MTRNLDVGGRQLSGILAMGGREFAIIAGDAPDAPVNEATVAALIAFLAVRLLVRWRHGAFDATPAGDDAHRHAARTPAAAFGIGLVHGMGGSAGVRSRRRSMPS